MMDTNSKKEKVDHHHADSDRLSDLPLSVVHIILALIPIREAVRTSVLSTQWRYKWTTLPQLVFQYEDPSGKHKTLSNTEIITQVLFRHKGPIHKFKLSCLDELDNVDEWISCLSQNDIQDLILDFEYEDCIEELQSMYSCEKLTYLSMSNCVLGPPPLTFKGFLFLRSLSIYNDSGVSLSSDYTFVSCCPLLEIFELSEPNGSESADLKFSAPYLKYMNLSVDYDIMYIEAPLMTEISVEFNNYPSGATYKKLRSSACDYAKCFGGFTNLQKLIGFGYFTKVLSFGIELCRRSLVFHHLKLIHLDNVNSEDAKEMMVVALLLIGAPNLEELKISLIPWRWSS